MMTFIEVKGHQRSNVVNCAMATKLGQKNPWCEFIMMMTFTEVKGHQRSNLVNYALWLPNLVRRIPDASLWWWWWWWPSWRSKVIRGRMPKLCAMATKLRRNPGASLWWWWSSWFMKVKGHQRSNVANVALWLPNLVRKNPWCKFMMVMTFMKVKGDQKSNVVNFALWLPNLVKRITNASLKWRWPSWRSKVKWG